ncbi:MAG: magnesium/cobalt transporter CorA [bacterium]|nr:magnesium/cobalt transporter CorA [bacterium]
MTQPKSRNRRKRKAVPSPHKAGLPPESVVYGGQARTESPILRAVRYDSGSFEEKVLTSPQEIPAFLDLPGVKWIDLEGLADTKLLVSIGQTLKLHPLLTEDIANTNQRTKLEEDGGQLIVFVHDFERNRETQALDDSQVAIALGKDFIFTFCEVLPSEFSVIRERLRIGQGTTRLHGPDFLLYRILDMLVDQYFVVLEEVNDRLESLQLRVLETPSDRDILPEIFDTRQELLMLRKSILPLRDVLSALERRESQLIQPATRAYFRDVYDHTLHVAESIDMLRDLETASLEVYLSRLSLRQNDVMRVLTVFSTIFLPLTFMVGIWGMNFHNMPELLWDSGYFLALGLMAIVTIVMLLYFKRQKWL